jgi:hypothetical protein
VGPTADGSALGRPGLHGAVLNEVGHEQREREKDQAEVKYPRKLCPLRRATRAGQKAMATQMQRNKMTKTTAPNVERART